MSSEQFCTDSHWQWALGEGQVALSYTLASNERRVGPQSPGILGPGLSLRPVEDEIFSTRVVQPRHHLFGRDRYGRIDLQFERDRRKLRGVTANRPAGGDPVLDAFMIDTDIAAPEILQGVKS